ncbi:hypothetical protein CY34DRAFT_22595 [Suillus luteus UH-Slu-Lm8-n1]|uniref:DUF6830 domain-containing protein n=1 Tax=Suillus luteus UH-Slu-Lm8-n1 TaxID=930992 RepID=A0A0D0A558_9AGAM|nr:hypothetical protein CY34DRAFT_22595 [Suillus luteus UH-Slu-Lm8-n1]
MHNSNNHLHANFNNDFNPIDNDFGVAEGSLEERYEGAGMCYSEDGQTFLDLFDADEFAEYRNENLFYPFTSKEEWEIADFLLHSPLSMAAIDMFLKLPLIQKLHLSFSNARELRSRAEMLPSRPSWKCQIIPSTHPTKYPIRLFWRDPIECLESLFSNPLFHDKLDFIPRRVYSTAAHLVRVYSEWMTGDAAWEMQTRFPRGATVLGTILSSDKTNITTMTGARLAHPLLLGLANICMHTHTKLSSKAFLLTALLPIPKYLYPHQQMQGVLEDRLIHECLSIVLKPLMKAAEVGIMMSDPVGNIRHCFTPLAAYIINTPEAAMLACFEALHHWHKEFFDHDCQWCLVAVGASELNFWFSILQLVTGYHHFAGRILKLKQVTGRGHHDIQHYIIGLISGAAPCRFVIAIHALMEVQYLAQSPAPDDDLLESIDQALLTFHQNKDIIMTLGARMGAKKPIENWHIPKLEFLQSITSGTRNICRHLDRDEKLRRFAIATTLKSHPTYHDPNDMPGDVPEEEDEGAINCDEQEQDDLRTALLEEMNQTRVTMNYFSKARQIVAARDGAISYPPRTFIAGGTAIHLNYNPSHTGVSIDDVATNFNILGLHIALSEFLLRDGIQEEGC